MSGYDEAMKLIYAGLKGKNIGVPFSRCPRLSSHISGTRKSCYYLYGAETGIGKTKFAREIHMYNVYDYYKQINDVKKFDIRFLDFSLEITADENTINAIIRRIYLKTGKVLPFTKVMGWEDTKCTPAEIQMMENFKPYFKDLEEKMVVIEDGITPTRYHDILLTHFRRVGSFEGDDGKIMAVSRLGKYTLNNPQLMTITLFDTINLSDNESGQTNKQSIDRISRITVEFRNKCAGTHIIVQQFNADNSEIQRQRHGVKSPQLRDFEDSKRTTKDANVVIGLWSPARCFEKTVKVGSCVYDITQLKTWYVSAHLLKNRNGPPNKVVPLRFLGATSMFEELPMPMQPLDYARLTKY